METALLSGTFAVRRLNAEDVDLIYDLCRQNKIFYKYSDYN